MKFSVLLFPSVSDTDKCFVCDHDTMTRTKRLEATIILASDSFVLAVLAEGDFKHTMPHYAYIGKCTSE